MFLSTLRTLCLNHLSWLSLNIFVDITNLRLTYSFYNQTCVLPWMQPLYSPRYLALCLPTRDKNSPSKNLITLIHQTPIHQCLAFLSSTTIDHCVPRGKKNCETAWQPPTPLLLHKEFCFWRTVTHLNKLITGKQENNTSGCTTSHFIRTRRRN